MMTPQDIREKGFEKAVFGGYDAGSVDNFLDNVAADFAAALKENSVLKSKMKILVDKIEEYRATEDAMRLALLSAQKLGTQIQNEAKEASENMINEAQIQADTIVGGAKREVKGEEQKLIEAKRASAQFIENMRLLCTKQLDFLDALGETKVMESVYAPSEPEPVPEPAPVPEFEAEEDKVDDTVRRIEDSVANSADEHEPVIDFASAAAAAETETADDEEDSDPTRLYTFTPDASTTSPRTQFSFETLTFEEMDET